MQQRVRVTFVALAAGGALAVWACGSPQQNQGSTSSSSGATSNVSNSSASGGGTGTPLPATTMFGPSIDDMTGQSTQTGGAWYTYSDRTIANSEPPINTVPPAPGSITPKEGDSFAPVVPGTANSIPALMYKGNAVSARECVASGEKTWGAGFGMDLLSETPDGAAVGVNMCDAGNIFVTDGGPINVGIPQPYDGSPYKGFSFWAISLTGKNLNVEVHIDDDQTTPWGGECNICRDPNLKCAAGADGGSTTVCPCSDNFVETFSFPSAGWKQFALRWTDTGFKVGGWSNEGKLVFHPSKMYNIHFQFTTSSGTALPNYDVAVAYLEWLTN